MTANTPQSRKAKGRHLQQKIRDDIINTFKLTENDVRSTSMGAKGCDILLSENARINFPYAIECKSQENFQFQMVGTNGNKCNRRKLNTPISIQTIEKRHNGMSKME